MLFLDRQIEKNIKQSLTKREGILCPQGIDKRHQKKRKKRQGKKRKPPSQKIGKLKSMSHRLSMKSNTVQFSISNVVSWTDLMNISSNFLSIAFPHWKFNHYLPYAPKLAKGSHLPHLPLLLIQALNLHPN